MFIVNNKNTRKLLTSLLLTLNIFYIIVHSEVFEKSLSWMLWKNCRMNLLYFFKKTIPLQTFPGSFLYTMRSLINFNEWEEINKINKVFKIFLTIKSAKNSTYRCFVDGLCMLKKILETLKFLTKSVYYRNNSSH